MMWDLETINRVTCLYVSGGISAELASQPEAIDAFRAMLASHFVHEAHALGVECRQADCHLDVGAAPMTNLTTATCRWMPETTSAELLGGHFDGRVYEIPDPFTRYDFRVPVPSSPDSRTLDGPAGGTDLLVDTYRLAGWREDSARWVYKIASR